VSDFLSYVAPLREVLLELADAAQALGEPASIPAADSRAMAEIAEVARYDGDLWTDSISSALSIAGIVRFAATDHLRGFGRLFADQPVPVYSHLVLARACLDACASVSWLSATSITATARVQRYHVARLMNAKELKRSPIQTSKHKGKAIQTNVVAGAAELGWNAFKDHPRIGNEEAPSPKSLLRTLLDDNDTFGVGAIGVSDILWWYLSGATHSTSYALMQSIEPEEHPSPGLSDPMAAISTNGPSVVLIGLTIARGYVAMVEEHAELLGWQSNEWTMARTKLQDVRRGLPRAQPES